MALLALAGAACASTGEGSVRPSSTTSIAPAGADQTDAASPVSADDGSNQITPEVTGEVAVFAPPVLTESFTAIGAAFSALYPSATISFTFAPSPDLVTQLGPGKQADVVASDDQASMTRLTATGAAVGEPQVFAANGLQIIVAKGDPKQINSLADLARPGVRYASAPPEVPIAAYAAEVLAAAGVTAKPASLEADVKAIVTTVTSGQADAGLVYITDVRAAGATVLGVELPAEINVVTAYPIVALRSGPNPQGGQAFVDFVLGDDGQQILADHGFQAP